MHNLYQALVLAAAKSEDGLAMLHDYYLDNGKELVLTDDGGWSDGVIACCGSGFKYGMNIYEDDFQGNGFGESYGIYMNVTAFGDGYGDGHGDSCEWVIFTYG